jgi:hypothetical protein
MRQPESQGDPECLVLARKAQSVAIRVDDVKIVLAPLRAAPAPARPEAAPAARQLR